MRVGIVHSYYRNLERSGENNVVDAQIRVLKSQGHEVALFSSKYSEERWQVISRIRAGGNVLFGLGDDPTDFLRKFDPEVILMHNLFPNISTNWLEEFGKITFAFKHNYRDVCASANLYRNGSVCLKCINGSKLNGIINRCYKDSVLMTTPIAIRNSLNIQLRRDLTYPRKFLVLSHQMVDLLETSGIPSGKCEVLPNFVFDEFFDSNLLDEKNGRWVAAGRMVEEKGFVELLKVWPRRIELDIFGDGPLLKNITDYCLNSPNIHIKGPVQREELIKLLPSYTGALVPSRWFEPGALVILEFLSAGLPIVSIGVWSGAAGLNRDWHIDSESIAPIDLENALRETLSRISSAPEKIAISQRQRYLNSFTPEKWYENLIKILKS